jgi:ferredoxin
MANKSDKNPRNAPGPYYVDSTCIGCEACVDEAPDNFQMDDSNLAFVTKQPDSPEQKTSCLSALEACPVQAIGDDA